MSNDPLITGQQVAEWNPKSQYQSAKERDNDKIDPLERRMRLLEGAVADMAYKLKYANESYEQVWKRLQFFEELLKSWEKRFLTSDEHDLMLECIKIIKAD